MNRGLVEQDIKWIVNNDDRVHSDFNLVWSRIRVACAEDSLMQIVNAAFLERRHFILWCLKQKRVPKYVSQLIVQYAMSDNFNKACYIASAADYATKCRDYGTKMMKTLKKHKYI